VYYDFSMIFYLKFVILELKNLFYKKTLTIKNIKINCINSWKFERIQLLLFFHDTYNLQNIWLFKIIFVNLSNWIIGIFFYTVVNLLKSSKILL